MANYVGYCRSSYFKVKSEEEYNQWAQEWNCGVITKTSPDGMLTGFIADHEGGLPYRYGVGDGECEGPDDFLEQLSGHLAPGWVAIVQEVGYEKMRYLSGQSFAVHADGNILTKDLNDIYDDVKEFKTTPCAY